MPSFHEFDVALTPNVPAAGTASRVPTNEVHINVWVTGLKGSPVSATLSDPVNAASGIGLTLGSSKPAPQTNAPSELILGDASGAWVLNLADLNIQPGVGGATLFAGVFLY